jgi:hypothetical protein
VRLGGGFGPAASSRHFGPVLICEHALLLAPSLRFRAPSRRNYDPPPMLTEIEAVVHPQQQPRPA